MSLRSWLSIITILLLGLIIYFAREEIIHAFELLSRVNLWILSLLIPLQILSYLAAGETMFSYLRAKGSTKEISGLKQARMALEMNFVNHTLPSAGVSGISYMTWRLSKLGVSPARATAAQLVRFVVTFGGFMVLLMLAVLLVTIDGDVNRWIILVSSTLVSAIIGGTTFLIYVIGSRKRIEIVSRWSYRVLNRVTKTLTFGRKRVLIKEKIISHFFLEMHDEYLTLSKERKLLIRPFAWGIVFNVLEVLMFITVFFALGSLVNPAPVLIALGLASVAGFLVATPGGAGVYEATMVSFLATSGVPAGVAVAGVLLARVILMVGTIALGYLFYQQAILKYGKSRKT